MKNKVITVIICIAAASAGLLLYYFYNIKTRNAVETLIKEKKLINILIGGSNKFNNNRHRFFSIISINPLNKNVGITLIPPSYRVRLEDDGSKFKRIDEMEVYNYNQLSHALRRETRLQIPFYIELYSDDVKRIVDLIEGINLYLFDQNKDFQPNAGLVYNDGSKIVSYINKVDANSIYLKYDRIQDIILTLYTNKEKMKPFVNSMLIKELYKSMRTNLLVQEIQTLGEMLCEEGDINIAMLPGNFEGNYYVMDDIAYKMYEKEFLGSIILEKTRDQSIKVKILNGTDVPGLARKMRNNLIKEGLNVVEFGTSSGKSVKESIIINRKGNYSAAKKISELTGIKNIYHVIDNTLLYNILVIIGEDYIK